MKNLILLLFVSLMVISSCTKVQVYPGTTVIIGDTTSKDDDQIKRFKELFVATWRSTRTSVEFDDLGFSKWIYADSINCNSQQQFDFVTKMVISKQTNSSDLRVDNTYKCSLSRTTFFEMAKYGCCGFVITEKDELGNVLKVYDAIGPGRVGVVGTTFI